MLIVAIKYSPLLTAQRSPYKWNQAGHSCRVMGAKR